jgi:MaoC like domain
MTVSVGKFRVGESRQLLLVDDLTRTQLVQYAGASGDYNPLHTDEIYATRAAGYPTVFAHGMWTMGATARVPLNCPSHECSPHFSAVTDRRALWQFTTRLLNAKCAFSAARLYSRGPV